MFGTCWHRDPRNQGTKNHPSLSQSWQNTIQPRLEGQALKKCEANSVDERAKILHPFHEDRAKANFWWDLPRNQRAGRLGVEMSTFLKIFVGLDVW